MKFEYDIGEPVTVLPLQVRGIITQRCDRGNGACDYQTVFWWNGDRKVEWLLSHELCAIAPRQPMTEPSACGVEP